MRFGTWEFQESVQVRLIESSRNEISKVKLGISGEEGVRWEQG
jgi:hypothetical protein